MARFEDMTDATAIAQWLNTDRANVARIHRGTGAGV